ncbi:hypothetical protein OUZ56_010541 [Daphnia magna]|uniref:Uncharacterized protein n=1 Tax=Daphnia magna TaxID=35525 RepID=A0ABR0AIV5_9CRUS|nr:hypothetical protein OUZ56_010541 [Daphnia magna]
MSLKQIHSGIVESSHQETGNQVQSIRFMEGWGYGPCRLSPEDVAGQPVYYLAHFRVPKGIGGQ